MENGFCYDMNTGMSGGALRRTRITRAEAAKVLSTSYQNVRRLQRVGQLHSDPDRYGVHRFDRREVEELARKRRLQIKPSGELAARVFAMFAERREFHEIVIETQQEPSVIRELWNEFQAGFAGDGDRAHADDEDREQAEHDKQMRVLDADLARRRQTA